MESFSGECINPLSTLGVARGGAVELGEVETAVRVAEARGAEVVGGWVVALVEKVLSP